MKNSRILLSALTAGILTSCAFGADVTGQIVEINDDKTGTDVYGGKADSGSSAINNVIKITETGIADDTFGGWVADAGGKAIGNVAIIKGKANKSVIGGWVDTGDATSNRVDIYGEVGGGVAGGYAATGKANNNSVIINDSAKISGEIYGGYGTTSASENMVYINTNESLANIYIYGGKGADQTDSNTIIIRENTKEIKSIQAGTNGDKNAVILIGSDKNIFDLWGATGTNNQLLAAGKNIKVTNEIGGFDEYFFALPTDISANEVMLTSTNPLTFKNGDKINVATQGGLTNLKKGEKVTLADNVKGFDSKMYDKNLKAKNKDPKLLIDTFYDFELAQDGTKLNAKLLNEKSSANEKSKAFSEGTAAAAVGILEAGELMADKGIEMARTIAAKTAETAKSESGAADNKVFGQFGTLGASNTRHQTGSYVDSKSINISVGVALGQEVKYGKVLVGPFIELGYSDYETHNDFSTGHVRGDGISKYLGGGIFARYDWNSYASGHPYVEGSVRFGRNKNSFDSTDMGQSYKSNAFYYGAHLGLGYIVEFQNNSNLDFYAKYFYTHLNSDDVTTNQGANLNLDAVNSHKTRFGARYNHALNNSSEWQIKPYVGLAWEHEYKGDANSRNGGYAVEAPSLEGSSGMAEIGVNIGKDKGLSADLGVAGYAGKRRGVAGNIMIKYEF